MPFFQKLIFVQSNHSFANRFVGNKRRRYFLCSWKLCELSVRFSISSIFLGFKNKFHSERSKSVITNRTQNLKKLIEANIRVILSLINVSSNNCRYRSGRYFFLPFLNFMMDLMIWLEGQSLWLLMALGQ